MAPGTTWRVKDATVLQGCCSSIYIHIAWQNHIYVLTRFPEQGENQMPFFVPRSLLHGMPT